MSEEGPDVDEPRRRALGEGAAQAAPTAPHATPRKKKGRRSGPERFWARWPVRIALALCLVVSGVAHCAVVPFDVPHDVTVNDYKGEADIPIDILEGESVSEPEPPPPPVPVEPKSVDPSAAATAQLEAGAPRDAGSRDAATDGATLDGAAPPGDAGDAGDAGEAGAVPLRDPQALLAASGAVQADVIFVTVVINGIEIRKNPVGKQVIALLHAIPDWADFMKGTETMIDPIADTDWMAITGPSLRDSKNDVVTLRYAASDKVVDAAVAIVSSHYPGKGGPYDAGVPSVPAWLAHADFAERAILRPKSHVLVIVPPARAEAVARKFAASKQELPRVLPWMVGVATYLKLVDPHHALPEFIPEGLTVLEARVRPRSDDGADVDVDADAKDPETAERAAKELQATIAKYRPYLDNILVNDGILNHAEVTTEGKKVHVHVPATRDDLEQTLRFVVAMMPQHGPSPSPAPAPPPAPAPSPSGAN